MDNILETNRLVFRKLCYDDMDNLKKTLQDEVAMYAYAHAFSDEEVEAWLQRQLARYDEDGFGLWALIRKHDGNFIGQCGLTIQENDGRKLLEIGYLLQRAYWHQGYAIEAAKAVKEYAFTKLHAPWVFSIIRDNNAASIKVAERNGMIKTGVIVKQYYHMDMCHFVYCAENPYIHKR